MRRRVISQWLTIPLKVGQNVRFLHSLQWAGGRILSALDRSEKPLDTAKDLIYTTLTINSPIPLSLPEGVNFSSIGLRLLSYTVITATSTLWTLHLT